MKKSIASATIAASLVGGAAVAVVLAPQFAGAQDETTTTQTDDAGPTAPPVGLPDWVEEALSGLVTDGVIDEEQADAVAAALEAARPAHREGPGNGPHGGMRMRGGLDAAADAIGIDEDALREALMSGQSIAEVAQANGVEPQAVIEALVADAVAHLDEEVAEGDLDQARADEIEAQLEERITAMVNGELPEGGPGPLGGRHGHHGPFDDADDTDDDGQSTDTPSVGAIAGEGVTAA